MSSAITIRGTRDGLRISLGAGEVGSLATELRELLSEQASFFGGGQVILHLREHALTWANLSLILQVLAEYQISVRSILGPDTPPETTPQAAVPVVESVSPPAPPSTPPPDSSEGVLVRRTLRSGQSVQHAGHVVVLGDVNPGAEIVAQGDIVVWGHLRGIVHAGAGGDQERCICALRLSPTQLRIGSHIARPPESRARLKHGQPEKAFVLDGQIVVEPFS